VIDMAASTQMNIRTTNYLLSEIDKTVSKGLFRSRSEAVNEAMRMLIRRYKLMKIEEQMVRIRAKTKGRTSLTKAIIESHEEE
jgi:Arc/MetJ-type ribon-helix-helix transcriptional regulator